MNTETTIFNGRKVEYFSAAEAALRLRVGRSTVIRWIKEGFFPNARKKNPHLRTSPYEIPAKDIKGFESDGEMT